MTARNESPRYREELARKLGLLMEVLTAHDGRPVTYNSISSWLREHDITLTQSRWKYMISGNRSSVRDETLLAGIAQYFEIDPCYLTGRGSPVAIEKVESALQYVRSERFGRTRLYAARQLGDVTPEGLQQLTKVLNDLNSSAVHPSDTPPAP